MANNGTVDSKTTQNTSLNQDYIVIECDRDGGKLQLRTEPPTFIELKKGENRLYISVYPDLKYGFMPADYEVTNLDNPSETGIISMDFRNFDSSKMTSMEYMFRGLTINESDLEGLDTSQVTSMKGTFMYSLLSDSFTPEFKTDKVTDMSDMFWGCTCKKIDLSSFDISKVKDWHDMFNIPPQLLYLDGWKLKYDNQNGNLFGTDNYFEDATIYMRRCSNALLKLVADEILAEEILSGEENKVEIIFDQNKELLIDKDNTVLPIADTHSFINLSSDKKTLLSINNKNVRFIIIPDGTTHIAPNAFKNCEKLHTVILPGTLIEIGVRAFAECKNLQWINIPDSIEKIGGEAFIGCKMLKSLYIGDNLKGLYKRAFADSGLEYLTMPLTVSEIPMSFWGSEIKFFNFYIPLNKEDEKIHKIDKMNLSHYPNLTVIYSYPPPNNYHSFPYTKNGVLIDEYENKFIKLKYGVPLLSAEIIPDDVIAVPEGVEYLSSYCINESRKCPFLYIPDSVKWIEMDAFTKSDMKFVTKKDNIDHLVSILPESHKYCDIYVL